MFNNENSGLKIFGYQLFGIDISLFKDRHYKRWYANGKYIIVIKCQRFYLH